MQIYGFCSFSLPKVMYIKIAVKRGNHFLFAQAPCRGKRRMSVAVAGDTRDNRFRRQTCQLLCRDPHIFFKRERRVCPFYIKVGERCTGKNMHGMDLQLLRVQRGNRIGSRQHIRAGFARQPVDDMDADLRRRHGTPQRGNAVTKRCIGMTAPDPRRRLVRRAL